MRYSKTEKMMAEKVSAKRHLRSGAGLKKGDASDKKFVYEIKNRKKGLYLSAAILDKIWKDSLQQNKEPAVLIQIEDCKYDKNWVVLPLRVFKELKNV